MAVFKQMFKKFLGFEEEFQEENPFAEDLEQKNSFYSKTNLNSDLINSNELQKNSSIKNIYHQQERIFNEERPREIVLYPKSFADACEVVENLEHGRVVVLNMEDVDIDTCKRIADFVLGAIYVLQGDVEKISKKSFRFWVNK